MGNSNISNRDHNEKLSAWSSAKKKKHLANSFIKHLLIIILLFATLFLLKENFSKNSALKQITVERDSLKVLIGSVDSLKKNFMTIDNQLKYLRELSNIVQGDEFPTLEDYYKNDQQVTKLIKGVPKENSFQHTPNIAPIATGWITKDYKAVEHEAIDYAEKSGTPIRATANGVVTKVYFDKHLGNIIEIEHGDMYKTLFGHCQNTLKRVGEDVIRGEVIATVGNTGSITTGPHLHYSVSENGTYIDPKQLIIRGF